MDSSDQFELQPEDEKKIINKLIIEGENDKEILSLNIAVVGKTGVGKSAFLNAFRGIKNDDQNAAKEGANSSGTLIEVSKAKYEHKVKIDKSEITINFFDTMGFMDNYNTDIETFLNKLKKYALHNISEFDAIIFITQGKLSKIEMDIAKSYEKKNVMLFFIYNQIDLYLIKEISSKVGSFSKKKSFDEQYNSNRDYYEEKLRELKNELFKLIKDNDVFSSLLSDIDNFQSNDLKSEDYKERFIKKSIYFITSNAEDFTDPILSSDGERLKKEITENLIRTRLISKEIDLLDPFSDRTIFLKKKFILKSLFSDVKMKLKTAGICIMNFCPSGIYTLFSLLPFANHISSKSIENEKKIEFMGTFGITDLKIKLDQNPESVSSNTAKIIKLKKIMEKIENDEIIKSLDSLFTETGDVNASNITEKLENIVKKQLPLLGISLMKLTDDILHNLKSIGIAISKATIEAVCAGARVVSVPLLIIIYVYFIKKALEKILFKHEEYALLLFEVIHN